ncbi:dNTP triphosphohydrolase [Vibrio lentus]|uniref:dGTP triphosphohydrolase n=1 Tax=Vibrio lentus TaxID=136468 RepID=UPI000C84C3B9|nr:dNTP triphosphohydrolase [Vibrio lentus]MCC4782123.1 dNTP triphosphohydrolase [Vibrio lentus]PMJ03777.1 deoxyguanosinetriphosphate triphosphohydrolase [Vibrio lentus]TKG15424.1 dNTP triphosphohydrolase [Vibrio lentus]
MEKFNSTQRHRASSANHTTFLASTQSDRARLIYSASFRRLQQKAQVFSLESNSAVRSRLTHSVEVSHIGRYIVAKISEELKSSTLPQEYKDYWHENNLALSNIVETACLMHDIGNPPFGHFGEAAISQWAHSQEATDCLCQAIGVNKDNVDLAPLEDFRNFDGNPQGFRIITKLQGEDGFYGLNLTYTQLAAFIKYTHSPQTKKRADNLPFSKKVGFFDTELDVINTAWNTLGMKQHSRHPLGFLMEASDDISYCISDIEDGIEKGIILESEFKKDMLLGLLKIREERGNESILDDLEKSLAPGPNTAIGPFLNFKTCLSNFLVSGVAEKFVANYEKFIHLDVQEEIISKGTIEYDLLEILKIYTGKHLFTSSEAECMELSGFSIISGILENYKSLLCLKKELFLSLVSNSYSEIKDNNLHIHRRLFNRLPQKHLNAYKCGVVGVSIPDLKRELLEESSIEDEQEQIEYLNENFEAYFDKKFKQHINSVDLSIEWNLRTHLIIDFISGMTDQFSMEFFQMLKGIDVKF